MGTVFDPIREGLKRGWKVLGGPYGTAPARVVCDVAVISSGAGVTAELLARAGLKVILVEEGPLKSSGDINQQESKAYPSLNPESAARKTQDKAINILQGRCVGGSTTVNWTSSFRTPVTTLDYWHDNYGLSTYGNDEHAPYFSQAKQRLHIGPWLVPANENNNLLRRGASQLGIGAAAIARNVKGCWNLGSCGLGCPTNAKQSMLVTTIPAPLDSGAMLLVETRAERFELVNGRVASLLCLHLHQPAGAVNKSRDAIKIVAKHYVLAAGAINSPAVLLRSEAPDPHGRLGLRTFLHPVVMSAAVMGHKVEGWHGAPQTIYSDHFLATQPVDGPIGYELEAPPLHPVIFASTVPGIGRQQADLLRKFPNSHVLLALLRDGFHSGAPGGKVKLRSDGAPLLDYPLTASVLDGARRAFLSMMEIQFAAGALQVLPVHDLAAPYNSWIKAKQAVAAMPMKPHLTKAVSAHVMGGCGLAVDEKRGVTRPDGVHWQIDNLSIHDGSLFPTSIGANPQLSVYGIAKRLAQELAKRLGARAVTLA